MDRCFRAEMALRHEKTDRTPLFEIFQPCHPIFWKIAGQNIATDMAMMWDAMSEGIKWEEILNASIKAQYQINKFFALDMIFPTDIPNQNYTKPQIIEKNKWLKDGRIYTVNPKTHLVELEDPGELDGSSNKYDESSTIKTLEEWDGRISTQTLQEVERKVLIIKGIRELAEKENQKWLYMGEAGPCHTAAAFYPPFLLMWMLAEEELFEKWLEMQEVNKLYVVKELIRAGCKATTVGGDVSSDRGPVISPELYRKFLLPVIHKEVELIHDSGAYAVYTSDGNHGPIIKDMFFGSNADGYKEVDKAAGMTWERIIKEGITEKICIIGNIDARHTLCFASPSDVKKEVVECLNYGLHIPGGHILHASHSVHEDVKVENYFALIEAYRDFWGIEKLPEL